jgi:hypothetical protein
MGFRIQPVGIVGDADIYGFECAKVLYGVDLIEEVVEDKPGTPEYEDHEGNSLGVVFDDAEYCGNCFKTVCACEGPRC